MFLSACHTGKETVSNSYTWTIPRVSSIPRAVGYVVKSPSFPFGGTSWTLKLFPNGVYIKGYACLNLERFETGGRVECFLYSKNISNKDILLKKFILKESKKEKSLSLLNSFSESVINDTLNLVINLSQVTSSKSLSESSSESSSESLSESISPEISAAEIRGTTDGNESFVGQILKTFESKQVNYKVSNIPYRLPSDYLIESPYFSFVNAKWSLKLKNDHKESLRVRNWGIVLQRLESQVPVHNVIFQINLSYPEVLLIEEKVTFDSSRSQSPALEFQLNQWKKPKLIFDILIKTVEYPEILLEKSLEKTPGIGKLVNDLGEMFKSEEHSDVIIKVKNEEFRLHKCILACRSPYFRSMFKAEMKEKATGVVTIDDCEVDVFRNYALFLYTGKVEEMTIKNVWNLYEVADKYQEDQLKKECVCFIKAKMSVECFCFFFGLALKHADKELLQSATDFFCTKTKEIIQNKNWLTFMTKYPKQANELHVKALHTTEHRLYDDERITKKRRINDNSA